MNTVKVKVKEIVIGLGVAALIIGAFSVGLSALDIGATAAQPMTASANNNQAIVETTTATADEANANNDEAQDASEETNYAQKKAKFVPPSITVTQSQWQIAEIASYALPMEEAAQIGAEYIWDIFDVSIDGMHVEMLFADWPSSSRTYWSGNVARSAEALDIRSDGGGSEVLYMFLIDAETGMRVDIWGGQRSRAFTEISEEEMEELLALRTAQIMMEFFEQGLYGRIAMLEITDETLEAYTKTATNLAERHFNNSAVTYVAILNDEWSGISAMVERNETGEKVLVLQTLTFMATDDTGRTAYISISATGIQNGLNISTQHNDQIPDFCFGDTVRG